MKIVKIGRNRDNDFVYQVPTISGYHADITFHDNGLCIYSDHSTNGTSINGKILKSGSQMIQYTDDIVLPGGVRLDLNRIRQFALGSDATVFGNNQEIHKQEWPSGLNNNMAGDVFTFSNFLPYIFSRYSDFTGRARRKEYWFLYLWNIIVFLAISVVGVSLAMINPGVGIVFSYVLCGLYSLVMLVPGLSVFVRRIHDINHHWTYMLFLLIPIARYVFLCIIIFQDSYPERNQWGPCPKERMY